MKFILASQSPRRKELLEQIGMKFDVMVSDADEDMEDCEPYEYVEKLSLRKAKATYERVNEKPVTVIGSDTVVVYDGKILGKPKNREEAEEMLHLLSGHTHEVYTGVTLIIRDDREEIIDTFHEYTKVVMYEMTDAQIADYLDSGEWEDKAGGYAIQGLAGAFVREIQGEYATVVGLPVAKICHILSRYSIDWKE